MAMTKSNLSPMLQTLLAALLFGASAPLAKMLLGEIMPVTLASFLYLGSGTSLLLIKIIQSLNSKTANAEALIRKADIKWLAGAILAGGVAAPITLLISLRHTPAATASLLLNFEGVATTLIAVLIFKEAINRQIGWAIALGTTASILLSVNLKGEWGLSLGALGIMAACLLWGLDNNFTRNISSKDPLAIVIVKGLGAGLVSFMLARLAGESIPSFGNAVKAMLLGSLSYGLSIVLFVHAMRNLGAARTSTLFSTAPLSGIGLSLLLFREAPGIIFIVALPLMVIGTMILLNEEHTHAHVHCEIDHEHRHCHDDGHYLHEHPARVFVEQFHSHPHTHRQFEHAHHHLPDIHHWHEHASKD